jgi:hypothetical protein
LIEIFQARSGCFPGFLHVGGEFSQVHTDLFNISQPRSGKKFSGKVCLKNFKQGPVDPDQQIRQGLRGRLKKIHQGPAKKF